jgi:hypothetical protein
MIFFYPETAGRSLEEIDLIFAKGFCENMSYVRAAKELPKLSDEEIEQKALEYGFGGGGGDDAEKGQSASSNSSQQGNVKRQAESSQMTEEYSQSQPQ